MTGEGQLVNLMHARYVDGLRDMVLMLPDKDVNELIEIANKLSTINVHNYGKKWGKVPEPQKILATDAGRVVIVEKKVDNFFAEQSPGNRFTEPIKPPDNSQK